MSQIQELVENRLKAFQSEADGKTKDWEKMLEKVDAHRKEKGEPALDEHMRRNLAILLENAAMDTVMRNGNGTQLFETTTTDASNIAFLGVQLPIIAAIIPSLALNDCATIQALDRRSGSVFYLNMLYGNNKDVELTGNTFVSATTGHDRSVGSRVYTSSISRDLIGVAGQSTLAGSTSLFAVKPGTYRITDGTEIWVDDGIGHLISNLSGSVNGTCTYGTSPGTGAGVAGTVSLTWTAHSATNQPVTEYVYDYENINQVPNVPSVYFNLTATALTAIDFPVQSRYTMASALDLKKAHGMDLESEIVKLLGGEVKFSMDHYGIDRIYQAGTDTYYGAGTIPTFAANPGSGQEFVWRKYQFIDYLLNGSNLIFNKTLRAVGNFIIADNTTARLIRQLKGDFEPAGGLNTTAYTGPHKIGSILGITVIQDPFIPANQYTMGYKGDSFLNSGFIFAPYIPLFSTPTLVTSDTVAQKGFMSSAGYLLVNKGMFCNGAVSGL